MRSATLYRVLAVLLVLIVAALLATHFSTVERLALPSAAVVAAGVAAGFLIGVVAAIMGVAGASC